MPRASAVGNHGRWSEKNVRVSSRFAPANGRLKREPEQRRRTTSSVDGGAERAALVDEPRDRLGERERRRRARDQQQEDQPHAVAARSAAGRRRSRRAARRRELREQHGRHRDGEHALRAACRCGTRRRSRAARSSDTSVPMLRVDQQVEVDHAEARSSPAASARSTRVIARVAPVEAERAAGSRRAAAPASTISELDDGADQDADRVGVDLVVGRSNSGREADQRRR